MLLLLLLKTFVFVFASMFGVDVILERVDVKVNFSTQRALIRNAAFFAMSGEIAGKRKGHAA